MVEFQTLNSSVVLLIFSLSFVTFFSFSSSLNIGVQLLDASVTLSKECSRTCESKYCSVPPLLRYGKYCGLLYSGCPGEKPCDGLDACCMKHDQCVAARNNAYLSQECSQSFIDCMENFKKAGEHTFKGNTCDPEDVIEVIHIVMKAALLAGRYLHKP